MDQPTADPTTTAPQAASRSGWIGGVATTLARRTGTPAGVIRTGWVGLVLLLAYAEQSVLAWIPILTYGACWFSLARNAAAQPVRPSQAAGHDRSPTTLAPPAGSRQPEARDGTPGVDRPFLREFVQHLWAGEPTPQPTYTADLTGVVLTGLQFPGSRDAGYYTPRMPFGKVYVYPDYLVFLTESHNPPGRIPELSRILPVLLDAWRTVGFWRPIRVAQSVYRKVTSEELDQLRKPLGNPNSIIVPTSQIRGVSHRHYVLTRYLVIHTTARDVMLAPNSYLGLLAAMAPPFLLFRNVRLNTMGSLGMSWEGGLLSALKQAAPHITAS